MEQKNNVRTNFSQLKESLDSLQNNINDKSQSTESLMRLSQALKDIDQEVNMLRMFLKADKNSGSC